MLKKKREAQRVKAEIKAQQKLLLKKAETVIIVPQVDANGYIDHKVDFAENLSESDSNSWCDEASMSYGDEEESSESPLLLQGDLENKVKEKKPRRVKEIIRLMPLLRDE